MSKKKKKETESMDVDDILNECASSLMIAMNYAVQHRDVEGMLAVSDRWLRLYSELSGEEDHQSNSLKIGFIHDHE
jgi:hypothetical protein